MAGIGTCRDCGAQIHWFRTPSGRTHPPLTPTTENVEVVIDGVVHTLKRWNRHVCDSDVVARRAESQQQSERRAEEARQQRREAEQAREQRRLLHLRDALIYEEAAEAREAFAKWRYSLAMVFDCPDCHAKESTPCLNLAALKRDQHQYTKNPHPARYDRVPEDQRPVWLSSTEFFVPSMTQGEK
jgi:hypothetical protein